MPEYKLHLGDCLDVMREMPDASVDAVVTDPPYGLSFMGKAWDHAVPSVEVWRECLRLLKPGGHLLAFAGTRTQHRMAYAIEDAGFEIRDMLAWAHVQGFPKSLDVGKAIDKAAGAERVKVLIPTKQGYKPEQAGEIALGATGMTDISEPVTPEAQRWDGWHTALKPAMEPITLARKPLCGTVAANVLEHGTGALNVGACRVGTEVMAEQKAGQSQIGTFEQHEMITPARSGRWPANIIHDGSPEVHFAIPPSEARFFYCPKASKEDRDSGGIPSNHPTVKPTPLMRYLCRLVTPPGGTVLDPFMGSGSTGKAAILEGFHFIGSELSPEYLEIARRRIEAATLQPDLFAQ